MNEPQDAAPADKQAGAPALDRHQIKVGCEVFVQRGSSLLLGKRKNCFGAGLWALPGGHLEPDERLVDAACRELREELGVVVRPYELRLASIVDSVPTRTQKDSGESHYIHATFEFLPGPEFKPKRMEPEFCEEWRFFALEQLPLDEFFGPHRPIIENYLAGRLYLLPSVDV